jgi:ATP-binding cassette subfamily F protein 3
VDFKGTVVFVSHDRYFIDQLAQKVIEVENGRITVYGGNYEDYIYLKSKRQAENEAKPIKETQKTAKEKPMPQSSISKGVSKNYLRKIEELETKITEKEAEVQLIEASMAEPGFMMTKMFRIKAS